MLCSESARSVALRCYLRRCGLAKFRFSRTHIFTRYHLIRATFNSHSRLQHAPLYTRGRIFSLSEQRVIILGRHLLGDTAEHIAPVFGLQADGSGTSAKSAEVIEAGESRQNVSGSTGSWVKTNIRSRSSPLHFLCLRHT